MLLPLSAAAQSPLTARPPGVDPPLVIENCGFLGRRELTVGIDRRYALYQILISSDPDMLRRNRCALQRHEHEAMPPDDADLDGGERRLIRRGVEVDGFQRPDLRTLYIDDVLITPVSQILCIKQCFVLP